MRIILIPVLMMFMLIGCGQPQTVDTTDSSQPVTTQTQPDTGIRDPVLSPIEEDEDPVRSNTEPTGADQIKSRPQATAAEKEPAQTGSPTEPNKPVPVPTQPSEPVQSETVTPESPTEETTPPPTNPEQSKPTEPTSQKPVPTEPTPTKPTPTEPKPTEPAPTEPVPTESEQEVIDTAALEAYGRSYASSAYGYNGTSACGPGSGAGYFPGTTKEILTMADGYSLVCRAIDAQYARDIASGYAPYDEIDGVTVRCPLNVRVEPTGQPNMYIIWVYYGGA